MCGSTDECGRSVSEQDGGARRPADVYVPRWRLGPPAAWDFADRGLVKEGMAADLVVFDADTVKPKLPTVERDLPGGARRLVQKADGFAACIVNGQVTLENGRHSGAAPGQVLKGSAAD